MGDIIKEYSKQTEWRNWESYLKYLPISQTDTILDLGCGTGSVCKMLSSSVEKVIGIDGNKALIEFANEYYGKNNIAYFQHDLYRLHELSLPKVDGIWASFSPAYFPDFTPVLNSWMEFLKPNGWIALVEIDDLFGHQPLNIETEHTFKAYYKEQYETNSYDFEMGGKLKYFLKKEGLEIIHEELKSDKELVFNGPAEDKIVKAWENRLTRMVVLEDFFW